MRKAGSSRSPQPAAGCRRHRGRTGVG
jgi:hypothetical protein